MKRFVLFSIADKNYALPLEQMVNIREEPLIYCLPRLPAEIAGVMVVSRTLIPVLQPWVLVEDGTADEPRGFSYYLIVSCECGDIAIPADQVKQIVAENRGLVEPPSAQQERLLSGTFFYRDSTFIIINVDYLVLDMIQGFGCWAPEADAARRHQ